ncbi:prepilin-type N-terminal cleavage/methylation domain-containing protein [Prosthecobacter fusiformis]|uniref:Prepilin-type N-terminal cleavage/methylation domain-containing protein n=1 Tax=Prosthecobacter fusiformis TaxID=48464 RepID=A0A4R7RY92_9BACT|nr:type II secretion system protein [Prosthecobacter fusiformis]TDU70890.1 prepilin-type N-terminal cleavage/methylation domain-containing protein [Prosthecobacter fusiformis]
MKTYLNPADRRGFTLIEVSLVIGLLLGLATFATMNISAVRDWQRGKDAAISLQAVFAAQRSYMADHPTAEIEDVASAELQTYLPEGWSTLPSAVSLSGDTLTIDHSVMPPQWLLGVTVYDPSGAGNDGLWDTGN